jgi:hypothetical protein
VSRLCSPGNRARGPTPLARPPPNPSSAPHPLRVIRSPPLNSQSANGTLGFGGWRGGAPPSAVSPFPSAYPKIQPCSPLPRSPYIPPPTFSASWRANCSFKSKGGGRGRRRGCAAALGAHLAPEPGEPRGGQETREPPLPAPPPRPPPPPPSRRCLPGFEPSPAEPRAPVETKTDRTAGTAATGSGGPDWGRWAPPQCAAQKSLAGRSPTASIAGQEALLTGVLGCRLRGSEPGEGFRGASIFRRRQRHGRPAAGKRSRRGALSRLPSLTAWLAPRLTFSAANSAGHGPPLPRRPPHHDYSFAICAPLASPAAHTLSQPWTPPPQPPNCKPGREDAPRSPPAPPPPPSSLPLCLSVCLSACLYFSLSLCLSLLSELGGKRK